MYVEDDSLIAMYIYKYASAFSLILTSSYCFALSGSSLLSLSSPFGDMPSLLLLLHLRPIAQIHTYASIYVWEESMHVYIVTKCDWSLRIYKHIAQGMRVHTIYTHTYCIRARLSFISHIGRQHSTCYFRYWYLFIIRFLHSFSTKYNKWSSFS